MNRKSRLTGILMTAWVLQTFIVILGLNGLATAAKPPEHLTVGRLAASVAPTSLAILLAASTTSTNPFDFNTNPGRMPAGVGILGPSIGAMPEPTGSFPLLIPDRGGGNLNGPRGLGNPYRRCPLGGFDCNL